MLQDPLCPLWPCLTLKGIRLPFQRLAKMSGMLCVSDCAMLYYVEVHGSKRIGVLMHCKEDRAAKGHVLPYHQTTTRTYVCIQAQIASTRVQL